MGTKNEIDTDVRFVSPQEAESPGGLSLLAMNFNELAKKRVRWAMVQELPNLSATPHPYVRCKQCDQEGHLVWGTRFEVLLPGTTSSDLAVNDIIPYVQMADGSYVSLHHEGGTMIKWGLVQETITNGSMATNHAVSVKQCAYDGSALPGLAFADQDAFTVYTPITPAFDTSVFVNNVVGYVEDNNGVLAIITPCQDEPIGTLRPVWLETAIRQGWRVCDETSCFDLRGRSLVGRDVCCAAYECIGLCLGMRQHGGWWPCEGTPCNNHVDHCWLTLSCCGDHTHGEAAEMTHNCAGGHTHDTIGGHTHDAAGGHTHDEHPAICSEACGGHTHDAHNLSHEPCGAHCHACHDWAELTHSTEGSHTHDIHWHNCHFHCICSFDYVCVETCESGTRVPSICAHTDFDWHDHTTEDPWASGCSDWCHSADGSHAHDPHGAGCLPHCVCGWHCHAAHTCTHLSDGEHTHFDDICAWTHACCGEHTHACCGEHTHASCGEHLHDAHPCHSHDTSCGCHTHDICCQCWHHTCTDNRPPSKVVVYLERFE